MKLYRSIICLTGSTVLALLCQCVPYDPTGLSPLGGGTQYLAGYGPQPTGLPMSTGNPVHQPKGYWDGDGVQGPAKIRINRSEQKAYFYKGGTMVGVTPISSGDASHVTPAGSFRVTQKSPDHKSSLYGVIKNIETGEIVNKNADTRKHKAGPGEVFINAPMPNFLRFNHGIGMHTGFLPGYAASHGCVRMPDYMARKFFENAKIGTPVIVE
jgi:hypothetical protein